MTTNERSEQRLRVAASNHRTGIVLSVIGGVLAAVALALVVVGGLAADRGGDGDGGLTAPAVFAFFGMVALIPGEQLRRGRFSFGDEDDDGVVRSRFRTISVRAHAAWLAVGLVVTALLVVSPVVSWFTRGWPHADRNGDGFAIWWVLYGSIVFGLTCAGGVSLLKKVVVMRSIGRPAPPMSVFWRSFGYRWRFDVWLGGVGGLLLAISFTALPTGSDDESGSTTVFVALLSIGLVLLALGLATATQFPRSGAALGSGEGAGDWRSSAIGRAAQRRL